jgi:L,D-peptidoglycan transpeptidase YkuD (ErfK/YbiS/YcfS/YnhG family)
VLRSGIRNFLLALALLPAGNPSMAVADSLATSDPVPDAYSVLQRHGLLEAATPVAAKSAPVISLPAPSTRPSRTVAVPTATSLTETDVLPRAYQRLRALGLLKSEPSSKSATALIADTRPKADRVVVDKSERKLFLMRNGQTFREFRISLGKAPEGPKLQEGDLRTPEGVYTLDWRNPKSGFYKSIHISYPNENDRLQALKRGVSPGGMIMIHGEHYIPSLSRIYRLASKKDWTEGCIALNNEEMDELWVTVADGTPIEIRP